MTEIIEILPKWVHGFKVGSKWVHVAPLMGS